jgi:hypothetical protein
MDGESFIQAYWRPIAAIVYLIICLFDFVLAPVLLGFYSIYTKSTLVMWTPLTTIGGGIFHISFGAIVGIYSYTRGQEILQTNNLNAQYYGQPKSPDQK